LAGRNDIQVFVNPRVLPEQYYDNNLLLLGNKVEVSEDGLNPVLDVSIDGRYVANGDFVNPSPLILARIWDENKYMLKTDTAGVRLFLTYPCGAPPCAPERILLTDSRVQWFPATTLSDFRVVFHPLNLPDGEYRLRVEGADARGNGAGLDPFEVTFRVKAETTLVVSDAYPNPTSGDVYFKVVISGSALPDALAFEVLSVNGQVRDRLTTAHFPALHIGSNELVWNGTSANGNALPNGIYIYKLTVGAGDKRVQRIGKIALLR
jgi:hypothetical protein